MIDAAVGVSLIDYYQYDDTHAQTDSLAPRDIMTVCQPSEAGQAWMLLLAVHALPWHLDVWTSAGMIVATALPHLSLLKSADIQPGHRKLLHLAVRCPAEGRAGCAAQASAQP